MVIGIVDLPIKNCDFPVRYVNIYPRVQYVASNHQPGAKSSSSQCLLPPRWAPSIGDRSDLDCEKDANDSPVREKDTTVVNL